MAGYPRLVNKNVMLFLIIALLHMFLPLVSTQGCYSPNRTRLLKAEPNCGEGQCYCVSNKAFCVGDESIFKIPRIDEEITELYAQCYNFINTFSSSFNNVNTDLKVLSLKDNDIRRMARNTFANFKQLRQVEIGNNPEINVTDLWNALENIPNKSNIQELHLSRNRLETVPLRVFRNFTSLQMLDFSNNLIHSIDIKDAYPIATLSALGLQDNHMSLENLTFCVNNNTDDGSGSLFPGLTKLNLYKNHVTSDASYNWNCLPKLEELNLRLNQMKQINITSFSNLTSLTTLNLRKNWIQEVLPGKFPPKLSKLHLQQNEMIPFPPMLCELNSTNSWNNSLTYLNLSGNHIQMIMIKRWDCLEKLEYLDLGKNDVAEYWNDTFYPLVSLKHLYLDNMIPRIHYIGPTAFRTPSDSIQTLILRYNKISFSRTENHGIFRACTNVTFLDISYNYFYGVTEKQFVDVILSPLSKLSKLKALHVSMQAFPVSILTKFRSLTYLNINRNHMNTIEFPESFNNDNINISLRELHVAECSINTLDDRSFPTAITKRLRYLDASKNEFACVCNSRWLRDQINMTGYIFGIKLINWPKGYECRSPNTLVGMQLKSFQPDETCNHLYSYIAVGSVVFVVVCIAVAIIHWRRWYIQYYCCYRVYRKRDAILANTYENTDPERLPLVNPIRYDGYIVYNVEDYEFVRHGFLDVMERKLNYKLHVRDRDADFGALVDVILDGMFASRQIIIIVSNNSIKSQLCKFQVDVAVDRGIRSRRPCVLLVVLEDTDFKRMSKSWCVLLAKNPKAYWSQNCAANDIKRKLFEQTVIQHCGPPLSTQ